MLDPRPVLKLDSITKRFGALVANDRISLDLASGEVLALLGENGSGKTTLMNILFGHYVADSGEIHVSDRSGTLALLRAGSPQAALGAGIGMVHQHFALAQSLTVLENVILGTRALTSATLNRRQALAKLQRLIHETGLVVDPSNRIDRLTVGERQRVELLKVLFRGARVLVLDEPTAVLTPQEADGLFSVLRGLAQRGLSVIFISHKLHEVLAIADRIVILRSGRKVAEMPVAGADRGRLSALMVGHDVPVSRREPQQRGDAALMLSDVRAPGPHGRVALRDVSLTVHQSEIVGIAGVSGNGQGALADLVAGMVSATSGSISLFGRPFEPSPRAAIDAGIGRIPEDRHHEGVVGSLSIAENLVIQDLNQPKVQRWRFLRRRAIREHASAAITAFDVRCPSPDTPVRLLSGGNIQKVILARELGRNPKVVLANQPTRGLDVGATAEVHRRLLDARKNGAAVLLISEDLDELFALSDRIGVMAQGVLSPPEPAEALTPERLGFLMAGQRESQAT
jgi:simple sugar transport system ATP-binding protein